MIKNSKTIGILGGMSAVSTQLYYQYLCERMQEKYGGVNSPNVLLRSVNFAEYTPLLSNQNWDEIGQRLNKEARALACGGAEILILATNTMHKMIDQIVEGLTIPHIHIATATANTLTKQGLNRPALLGTKYTMAETFYVDNLRKNGLEPLLPDSAVWDEMNRIIMDELCKDIVHDKSQKFYFSVVEELIARGADSLVLGCTEIGLLITPENSPVAVCDTVHAHCEEALRMACAEGCQKF